MSPLIPLAFLAPLALSAAAAAQSVDLPLGPKDGYLHVHASDSSDPATVLALSTLGAVPGQSLLMAGFGDMDNGPSGDTILSLIGLYSSSATLLGPELLHRVPGAIDAGPDFVSAPTFKGAEPTDIPEDFRITGSLQASAIVEIPAGATHLFIGHHESQWFDNSDPDGDLGCSVTVVGTWKDLGAGLAGTSGTPALAGSGLLLGNDAVALTLSAAHTNAPAFLIVGFSALHAPFKGGTLVPDADLVLGPFTTSGAGGLTLPGTWPAGVPELLSIWFQAWVQDPAGPQGFAASNGVKCLTP